jgi:hypothetical protein
MFNFDFLFFMLCKLDVCMINPHATMPPPSLERTLSLPMRDHRNTIRKYCSNCKYYSNNNIWMDEKINRTRGSAVGQVDQRKKTSAVKYSLWTTRSAIRLLEVIMSKHIFLPSIGHMGQSETPVPACARGRSDKVYETVTSGTD